MSHPAHWHDEHDSHWHDDHDTHWHDEHHETDDAHWWNSHNHDDHSDWHNEHENHEHDEEYEEKEFKKLNDLIETTRKDLKDVDIGKIHILSPLIPFKKLFKKNTLDISNQELAQINLSFHPKIKILHLKRPIHDIIKIKKNKVINIKSNNPKIGKNTLNLLHIENIHYISWPYSDLIKPKQKFKKNLAQFFTILKKQVFFIKDTTINEVNASSNQKKTNYSQVFFFIIIILWVFLWYGFFTKYMVENTINKITNITISTNVEKIKMDLISIKSDLILSDFLLYPIFLLNWVIKNEMLYNAEYLINGTKKLIDYAINGIIVYDWVHNIIQQKWPSEVMYSEVIKNIEPILLQAKNNINQSILYFSQIKDLWNKDMNNFFYSKLDIIKNINNYTNIFYKNKDIVSDILWDEKKRTYIIIFQNSDEIRPTGWFMWSVWFIQVYKWKILNFEKKDIYAIEWWLKNTFNEKSPEWLSLITDTFTLRDANYFINIWESSNKIKSFLDESDYKVDGIVYINQNIILDFLKNFGWIYFDAVKKEITADNFSMIMSTLVEAKVSKTHTLGTPKQVLFDFIDIYFAQLKKAWKYPMYIKSIFDSIEKKDIIFYSFYEKENNFLSELWLSKKSEISWYLDFNYPVFTSVSWNKSDRYIERIFTKKVKKNTDCSIETELNIHLKHNFDIAEEINIKNFLYDMNLLWKVDLEATLAIQWKALNKSYIRVQLPKNVIIKENKKMKIIDAWENKEVSFYMNTNILFPTDFTFSYTIPNLECKKYNYLFIKQPGIKEYKLNLINDGNLILDSYLTKDYKLK